MFFRVMIGLGLRAIGETVDRDLTEESLRKLDALYLGDGWYRDGPVQRADHYIAFAFHFYALLYGRLGDDPEWVGKLGAAMVSGLQEQGVAACAKHFPGHGDTDVDSHLALPMVDHSRSRLEDVELRPFRAPIAADVAAIMTAHVLVRELDDQLPATLSPRLVSELLRGEMKYAGVVVADDLEMKAVAARWPPRESATS